MTSDKQHRGYTITEDRGWFNCPELKLYGYSTLDELERRIDLAAVGKTLKPPAAVHADPKPSSNRIVGEGGEEG